MGRRKKDDPHFETFRSRLVYLLDDANFEGVMKYLYFQAQKHGVGFTSIHDDGLYDSEWSDTATRHIYAGLGYDLFTFCGRFGFSWPEHAEIILEMLFYTDKDQIFNTLTPDICPPPQHWQMFRMARTGLGFLTDQERESARKVTDHMRARKVDAGLTAGETAAHFDVAERTVRNAVKECWSYLDQGGRANAAAALGWPTYLLDRAIESKIRQNKTR